MDIDMARERDDARRLAEWDGEPEYSLRGKKCPDAEHDRFMEEESGQG